MIIALFSKDASEGVRRERELDKGGQKVQTSSSEIKSSRDMIYNMVTIVNTAV